jgi:ABC-type ATPase involved in cell division
VGLPADSLDRLVNALSDLDRFRLHLARAVANGPQLVLLEHPTATLPPADATQFGQTLRAFAERRGFGFLALSNDEAFAKATRARRLRLESPSGQIKDSSGFLGRLGLR